MDYYPEHRHILDQTTIQRERLLPEHAIGRVEVRDGASVNLRDVVARGRMPSRYVIIEAAHFFRLKDPTDLDELMLAEIGEQVDVKTPLAGRAARGGRRLLSPVKGVIAQVSDGRIIIQVEPEEVELEAGLDGQVVSVVAGRGILIETYGALVQGVWGNGRRAIGAIKPEPEDGLESLMGDDLNIGYRGAILVTRRPLRASGLEVMADRSIEGVIAPSMDADLIEPALQSEAAILLTEGFGSVRMSATIFTMLSTFSGRQGTLDAVTPGRWEARRPEVIINPSGRAAARPPRPNHNMTLQVGSTVRLTRGRLAGQVGKIVNLPKTPYLLENGLRVFCAQVETITGEKMMAPLANLEVFGR